MSYSIARMEKCKANSLIAKDKHNNRKNKNYGNKEIDRNRTHLNYDLVPCDSYTRAIKNNINKYYKGEKAIRSDANVGVEVLFTSDEEFFKELSPAEQRKFFEKSLEFLQDFAGKENIIGATVHMDETTPHMHAVFTPIDKDGRLRYRSFIDKKYDLTKFQDMYHAFISKDFPQLERGERASLTKRKHLTTEELKAKTKIDLLKKEIETKNKEIKAKQEEITSKNKQIENKKKEIDNLNTQYLSLEKEINNKMLDSNNLKNKIIEVLKIQEGMEQALKQLEASILEKKEKEKSLKKELETSYDVSELERLEENSKKIHDIIQEKGSSLFGGYKFTLEELNEMLKLNSVKYSKLENALKNLVNSADNEELRKKLELSQVETKKYLIKISKLENFVKKVKEVYPDVEENIKQNELNKWDKKLSKNQNKGLSR